MHILNGSMHRLKIEERRSKVASLIAQSRTELEIAAELGVDQSTISRDVKYLKSEAQKWVYDLAKQNLAYYYRQSINEINEISRKAWDSYYDNNIDRKTKLLALRLAKECTEAKFNLFQSGPSIMNIKALDERVNELARERERDRQIPK
jgi:transposase